MGPVCSLEICTISWYFHYIKELNITMGIHFAVLFFHSRVRVRVIGSGIGLILILVRIYLSLSSICNGTISSRTRALPGDVESIATFIILSC